MFSLLSLRGALKLEICGLKRRGRAASVIARGRIGSRTRDKKALLVELEEHIIHFADVHLLPRPQFAEGRK